MFFRNGSQVLIHRRFFFTQDHGTYIIQKNIQTQEEPTQKKDTLWKSSLCIQIQDDYSQQPADQRPCFSVYSRNLLTFHRCISGIGGTFSCMDIPRDTKSKQTDNSYHDCRDQIHLPRYLWFHIDFRKMLYNSGIYAKQNGSSNHKCRHQCHRKSGK